MPSRVSFLVIVGLLAIIIGVPFALRPQVETAPAADAEKLVIVTPHNEQIRYEFARAFNQWRLEQGKAPIVFDWRTTGGTSDLRKQVLAELSAEYERARRAGRAPQSIGYDLFFGGGDFEHDRLADGITIERDGEMIRVPAIETITLPPGLLEQAFPSAVIGSERLYHRDMLWIGAALSSFGIVYNRDVLTMLDLPEPTTWADLQDGRYLHWLALADPSHSGSIGATYNAILRRYGWHEGWAMLRRMFANGRYFVASATKVPTDVSAGEAAAGMCIDFYGRFQAGAIRRSESGDMRVGYGDPAFVTAITADPIAIVRQAPHRELAHEFIVWLLSGDGQNLWQKKLHAEGGPDRFELRRLPIRRDMYTPENMAQWTDAVNPFAIARPFPPGMPTFFHGIGPITQAMAIDTHRDLIAAWQAILQNPHHPRRAEMVRLFDEMPADLTIAWPDEAIAANWQTIVDNPAHPRYAQTVAVMADFNQALRATVNDADALTEARLRWTSFFKANYREIVVLSRTTSE